MDHNVRINLATGAVVAALAIGVSLVVSVGVGAWSYRDRGRHQDSQGRLITTKGSARQRITADLCVWKIGISGEGPTLQEAFARLDAGRQRISEFLAKAGFAPAEAIESAISTEAHYTRDAKGVTTRQVEGYSLVRTFTVTTPSVDRAARAAGEITALLKDGVLVRSESPEFLCSKLADLKASILGDASRDARTRAEEVARNTGAVVAEVRSATMGPLQVVQPNSTDVTSYGIYDTTTIEKDVTAVVTVTFVLSPS